MTTSNDNGNDTEPDQTIEISHDAAGSATALVTVEDEDFGTLDMREIEPGESTSFEIEPGMYHINVSIPVTVEKPVGELGEIKVQR